MSKQSWRGSTLLNPEPPVLVLSLIHISPAAIGTGQHHRARRRTLDGSILCAGIVLSLIHI